MKIYVCNYEATKLTEILSQLDKYFSRTELKYEMYSEQGMFIVNNNKTYSMKINMDKTEKFENYIDDWDLWVDSSEITYELASQIPVDILVEPIIGFVYEMDKKSKIKMIVDGLYDANISIQVTKINKYKGFVPRDFYFYIEGKTNMNDLNIKEELNEFLSLLN